MRDAGRPTAHRVVSSRSTSRPGETAGVRPHRPLGAIVMLSALALGACSGDGSSSTISLPADVSTPDVSVGDEAGSIVDGERDAASGDAGSGTPSEPDAIQPEQPEGGEVDAPASEDSGGVVVVAVGDDGGVSTEEWIALILLGALVIGVIIGLVSWVSGRSRRRRQHDAERSRQLSQVVGGARWAHDQAAMTVLATTDPTALQSTWAAVQSRLFDLEASIATSDVGDSESDAAIAQLGQRVGDLQSALAADVALRLSARAQQPELVENSRRTVLERNDQLERALDPLVYAQA